MGVNLKQEEKKDQVIFFIHQDNKTILFKYNFKTVSYLYEQVLPYHSEKQKETQTWCTPLLYLHYR